MPGVFAFADQVIGNPQTSLFAAFGSFAVLVLVEFGGVWRTRLVAYLTLAAVGAVFIALGTLWSRDAWLAAGATGAVGFVTLFSGAFNGYFAAASTGAILLSVLPANIPAPNSAIPDPLLGLALAADVRTAIGLRAAAHQRTSSGSYARATRWAAPSSLGGPSCRRALTPPSWPRHWRQPFAFAPRRTRRDRSGCTPCARRPERFPPTRI